jgi:hypothetical protein
MKHGGTIAAIVAVAAVAAFPTAVPARSSWSGGPSATAARTCSAGFKHARINGVQKCLRRGEFCAHRFDHRAPRHWPYSHYGYRCVKRDSRGNYHLTRR